MAQLAQPEAKLEGHSLQAAPCQGALQLQEHAPLTPETVTAFPLQSWVVLHSWLPQ